MFHVKLKKMEKITSCDLCGNKTFTLYLEAKDYFLTNEEFTIVKCDYCGLLFVNPRPSPAEISIYYKSENYISHSTKQAGFLDKVYAFIRKKNHIKKYKLIRSYKNSGSLIDIGCATGEFLDFFQKKGWDVTGVEPNEDARNFARNTYSLNVIDEKNIAELPEKKYDVVTMWHVLEHVHDLNERLNQIDRILKNDGIAVIAVPNPNSNDASFYKSFWAGYDLPRHLYHFSQKSITALFEKKGFRLQEKIPLGFDSFYISMISEKYKTGKKNLIKAFYHGLKSNIRAKQNNDEFSSLIYIFKKTD